MQPRPRTSTLDVAIPPPPLSAERTRGLLRKLRDLDLRAETVVLSGNKRVRIDGCLSLDSPVECSLRYRIHHPGGREEVLELRGGGGTLEVDLGGEGPTSSGRTVRLPLLADHEGHAVIPDVCARVDPESHDRAEIERFLRRLVRAAYAPI